MLSRVPSGTPQRMSLAGPIRISLWQCSYCIRTASVRAQSRKPAGFDDGDVSISQLAFAGGCEFEGYETGGVFGGEHACQAFACAGGVDHDVLWLPGVDQGGDGAEDLDMVVSLPFQALDYSVDWLLQELQTG